MVIKTIIGDIYILTDEDHIKAVKWSKHLKKFKHIFNGHTPQGNTPASKNLIHELEIQISEYFKGNLKKFDLPLKPEGTDFQKKIWKELLNIPYGRVSTYTEIAYKTGNPKAVRAVGNACKYNPISIIIPCHRVLRKNGGLGGYGGGITAKKKLLELEEKSISLNNK